jgi:hypothetical protein
MASGWHDDGEAPTATIGSAPDIDRQILQKNLYGVGLNGEAVEICRLSLWTKTAQRGKPLTSLDHNVRVGNSVVDGPKAHPRAFDWQSAFPEVFAAGGFDVAIGNPPYIRQEWLAADKGHREGVFESYNSVADILRPREGRRPTIVTSRRRTPPPSPPG